MKYFLTTIFFILFFINNFSFAQAEFYQCNDENFPSLVVCGRSTDIGGRCAKPCTLDDIGHVFTNLMYIILYLFVMIAPLYLVYVGYLFIKAQGMPDQLKNARKSAVNFLISLGLFLSAWLIIASIAGILGVKNEIPSFLLDSSGNEAKPSQFKPKI